MRITYPSTAEAEEVVDDARFGRTGDGLHSAMIEALEARDFRGAGSSSQASASELRRAIPARSNTRCLPGLPLQWVSHETFSSEPLLEVRIRRVGAE